MRSGSSLRQIAQHDGVQHAEDRGVGANAERERQDSDRGEPGAAGKRSDRVAKVLQGRRTSAAC